MFLRTPSIFLSALTVAACTSLAPSVLTAPSDDISVAAPLTEAQFSEDLSRRTFDYFWETTDT